MAMAMTVASAGRAARGAVAVGACVGGGARLAERGGARARANTCMAVARPADAELDARLAEWSEMDASEGSMEAEELVALVARAEGDSDAGAAREELRARMCSRLAFGTAGLRGLCGAGFSRMNSVVVAQTTQGLCAYAEAQLGVEVARERGVAIGYDARANSDHFARVAAGVFASHGWRVALMGERCPTPLLAAAVQANGHAAGVMVTASHNPKEYNGYKVYWGNGCQIIPPHDEGIASAIEANLALWERPSAEAVAAGEVPGVFDSLPSVADGYYAALADGLRFRGGGKSGAASPRAPLVAYTPLHGVGGPWAARAFEAFGLPAAVRVESQAEPDAEFPTVTFPNPEEGAETWELAFEAAAKAGVPVVLANDPDADRLAAAEWDDTTARYESFTGNEIATLLAAWMWSEYHAAHPDVDPSRVALLGSTVSSKMFGAIAAKEGLRFDETLTGFKWLGNRARELQAEGYTVLFAFEEAIGFAFPHALTPDKDGVAAAAVFTEMAYALREEGKTVRRRLGELYEEYGAYQHRQGYVVADPVDNAKTFERLRAKYATEIGGKKVRAPESAIERSPCDRAAVGSCVPRLARDTRFRCLTFSRVPSVPA